MCVCMYQQDGAKLPTTIITTELLRDLFPQQVIINFNID